MFGGFFKKISDKGIYSSIENCSATWSLLTERDQKTVSKNMLGYAKFLAEECRSIDEALATVSQLKQIEIKKHSIRDESHPAFIGVEAVRLFILPLPEIPMITKVLMLKSEMTTHFTPSEKQEFEKNILKF